MAFITEGGRRSFAAAFAQAVERNFSYGDCRVQVRSIATPSMPTNKRSELILLTSSSLRFRLTAVFRVLDEQLASQSYVQAREAQGLESSSDFVLQDQLREMGNMACGELNRELLQSFANVALSSPSSLDTTAERLFKDLRSEHVAHFGVFIGEQLVIDASLCMIAKAPVDFSFKPTPVEAQADAESGALELF
jgi:hypothetical protein